MKRLIDAYELAKDIQENAKEFDYTGQSCSDMIEFVLHRINMQQTIICVSDDFGCDCGYIASCKTQFCGAECAGEKANE